MSLKLLPTSKEQFSKKSYWDDFFEKRQATFEWYGTFVDLCDVIHKYCGKTHDIMMVGCGNSELSEHMYDSGFTKITNIDISERVIKQMADRNRTKRKQMAYVKKDITDCSSFNDASFDTVFDKGTLDAMFTGPEAEPTIRKMFDEISRLVPVGGRYICISLAQPHILYYVLRYFSPSWFIKVHQVEVGEDSGERGLGSLLPVFALVLTKANKILPKKFLELNIGQSITRFSEDKQLCDAIKDLQDFAFVQSRLQSASLDSLLSVEIYQTSGNYSHLPRYTLAIVDTCKSQFTASRNGSYAVFITPRGVEMFRTDAEKQELACMCGYDRLAIATLNHAHTYGDLDEIKSELSEKVMSLAPGAMNLNEQVPFLTSSEGIGSCNIEYRGLSDRHGEVIIDTLHQDDLYFKRLVFLDNPTFAPIYARLRLDKKKSKSKKRVVDNRYLLSSHMKRLFGAIACCPNIKLEPTCDFKVLMVGLRSTLLIGFLLDLFSKLRLNLIPEDDSLANVIEKHFNLPSDNVQLLSQDATVNELPETSFDIVINDSYLSKNTDSSKSVQRVLKKNGLYVHVSEKEQDSNTIDEDEFNVIRTLCENLAITYCIPKDVTVEHFKKKSNSKVEALKDFITSTRKDFYEKSEWTILNDVFL